MKLLKSYLIVLGSVGLVFLGACSNSNQAANPGNSPTESSAETTATTEPVSGSSPAASHTGATATTEPASDHANKSQGGQVVESGNYHLELVSESESNGTHLDLYVQRGDNHEAIPNAKVTAQVQAPDGTQKTLPFTYDTEGKHYTAMLADKASGQYQVKVTSEINGEKADGRFSFNK